MRPPFRLGIPVLAGLFATAAPALEFALPTQGDTVVGEAFVVTPTPDNTLFDLARYFDTGALDITLSNPRLDPWVPGAGQRVIIPTEYILPPKPWRGIVVNIPQRRLFYFPPKTARRPATVITFPVSIAREGWSTPLGDTRVVGKYKDPAWIVPRSIKAEHEAGGEPFPDYFPPGVDNPMGMLAIQTGFRGIFIHGTNKPWGLGLRQSHGCLHLYPEDAVQLFGQVAAGLPVRIENRPLVVGIRHGGVVMARYPGVSEYPAAPVGLDALRALIAALPPRAGLPEELDWARAKTLLGSGSALPVPLAVGSPLPARRLADAPARPYTHPPYGSDANQASPPVRPGSAAGTD